MSYKFRNIYLINTLGQKKVSPETVLFRIVIQQHSPEFIIEFKININAPFLMMRSLKNEVRFKMTRP